MVTNVKSYWSGGDLYFADKDDNVIFYIDGTSRKFVIPSGSTFTCASLGLDTTELGLLDGATAGSLTASKVVTRRADQGIPLQTAVVAAVGANQGNGAALTKDVNLVTSADNTTCVVLPTAVAGMAIRVVNTVANKTLPVFPASGAQINGGGADAVFTMGAAKAATFICTAALTWYVEPIAAATATAAELNYLAGLTVGVQAASKAVVADANVNTGIHKVTQLHIGASGSEVQVTATPAQLNLLAGSIGGLAAVIAGGLGGSDSIAKTEAATHTLVASHATKDRAVLAFVRVDETYAVGTGTLPTVKLGETGTTEKFMAVTVLDTEAAGTVYVYAGINTAGTAIVATSTAAIGNSTGGCTITVIAIPTT